MKTKLWLVAVAVAFSLAYTQIGAGRLAADDKKGTASFGALEAAAPAAVQAKALAWLKAATNNNAAKLREAEALWSRTERSVLDNLADTFGLGNADAAALLKLVRDDKAPPPAEVPALLKDAKADPFFRANLGLAVARHLANRRVHEEALAILSSFTAEQTIDPATYLFNRAVSEHALLKRDEANKSIARLMHDAGDSPERYKTVSALILLDMTTWKKDLGNVARLMDNSERRLEVGRAGPQTQKIQKEVVARLDELIKELENKAKKQQQQQQQGGTPGGDPKAGDPNGGSCPDGGTPGDGQSGPPNGDKVTKPAQDSGIATNGGSGKVDIARLKKLTDEWGKLPPGERTKVMAEVADLVSGLSPIHREAFERYFEEISSQTIRGAMPANKKQ